jgi:F-type H+-transporting ATPase subunit epsilon
VAGGFAEVTNERCTVLAEQAVPVTDINTSQAEEDVRNLEQDLAAAQSDIERAALDMRLAIAKAKLQAVTTTH